MSNINMTLSRRILREPDFSGQPVLSGHLEGARGCPLKWVRRTQIKILLLSVNKHATLDGVVYFFSFDFTKLLTLFKKHY